MFNIDAKPVFTTPVIVKGFGDDGQDGGEFTLTFRVRPVDEFSTYDLNEPADVAKFLLDTVVDGSGFIDEAKEPVNFTVTLLERLMDWPHVRRAMVSAYLQGLAKASQGN